MESGVFWWKSVELEKAERKKHRQNFERDKLTHKMCKNMHKMRANLTNQHCCKNLEQTRLHFLHLWKSVVCLWQVYWFRFGCSVFVVCVVFWWLECCGVECIRGCTFITLESQSQKMKILPISAYVFWLWLSNVIKVQPLIVRDALLLWRRCSVVVASGVL